MISCHRTVNQLSLDTNNDDKYFKRELYQTYSKANGKKNTIEKLNIIMEENIINHSFDNIIPYFHWLNISYFTLKLNEKKANYTVQCLYIENKNTLNKNKIVVFNQGENTNLVSIFPFLVDLSSFLKLNVVSYEYIKDVKKRIVIQEHKELSIKSEKIVLAYFSSLPHIKEIDIICFSFGTYVNLITLKDYRKTIIIKKITSITNISPLWYKNSESNKRNFMNSVLNAEMFKNYISLKIPNLLIHGKEDKYFKFMLSMAISKRLNYVIEWYPSHGTHFGLLEKIKYKRKITKKIKELIYSLSNNCETDVTANFVMVPKTEEIEHINFENNENSNDNEDKYIEMNCKENFNFDVSFDINQKFEASFSNPIHQNVNQNNEVKNSDSNYNQNVVATFSNSIMNNNNNEGFDCSFSNK